METNITKRCLAIIPARGGSKRIPRKNVRPFMGKPMMKYAIDAALECGLFSEVMVSTDDTEIADIAKQAGANVPFMRSAKTSDDYASTADVLLEVLEQYHALGRTFETLCCVYPCVPFITSETLRHAFREFEGYDALIPVCKYPVPVEWALKIEEGYLLPRDAQALNIRSQDLIPKYHDAGMFYFSTVDSLAATQSLLPKGTRALIVDEMECQDIDTLADWEMAELKYQLLQMD
jgi:N-acylneuraminate cytidylyltransferase